MSVILVGTADGLHTVGDGHAVRLRGRQVDALTAAGGDGWAVVDGSQLWHGAGGSWEPVARLRVLRANCVAVASGRVLVGTSEAHLLRLDGDRLGPVEAFERAEGRDGWYTPWGGPPDTRWLAVAPDGAVYAAVHVGGVLRAADVDGVWQPTIDVDADAHQVAVAAGERVFAATAHGLAVSDDGGGAWVFRVDGLHASYLRALAVTDRDVLVSASTGPSTSRAALYRSPLVGGGPLARCRDGLPEWFADNIDTGCLDAAGRRVAFGTADGQVYASDDGGGSWERVADGLPPVRCLTISGRSGR